MLETALHAHLAAAGARHGDDRGVLLPESFGDDAAEYAALREGVAILDLGFRTLVRATGADRVSFLQGMLTADVAALRPGEGCPALLLTVQGRVTADLRVAATPDVILLECDVRARDGFVGALERLIVADEVELGAPDPVPALLGLEGPAAAALLAGTAAEGLAPYGHAAATVAGVQVQVMRASEVRGLGYVLTVPAPAAAGVWDSLVAAGARPCGMRAVEARRVERGVPRIGVDMDGSTLALEVPVDEAISGSKGCYLGQEVVARGTARGHVNRRLVGLTLEGPAPQPGAVLVHDAREVGRLTSVAWAFGLQRRAALGFVRREHWEPGTELRVGPDAASARARIMPLPLV